MSRFRSASIVAVAMLALTLPGPAGRRASAQAIGFGPVIGGAPSGVGMSVTPVATADRRYVRLGGLNATFSDVLGFDTAVVTGAVGGGGIGGGFQSVGVGATGFGASPYGYGGYPAGGYGVNPYGYGRYPYSYGGVQFAPPSRARTVNGLGALGNGIMNATRAPWYRP